MIKEFLPFQTERNDALHLAHRMFQDGIIPDVIYCSMRGGAYMANVISEYYKIACPNRRVMFAAVVAHSYAPTAKGAVGGDKAVVPQVGGDVYVEGWSLPPERLRPDDIVMFIDDIFDSGRTVNALVKMFLERGIERSHIVVAVHDYKCFTCREKPPILPDYWCNKIDVDSEENDKWIHYMSHELSGLTEKELIEHYYSEDASLEEVFRPLYGTLIGS